MIYVTGDTHGEYGRFMWIDRKLQTGDILIICGDAGLLFKDDFNEHKRLDEMETKPYTILFVDGNHENFDAIYSYPQEIWNGGKVHRIRKNVLHLCRGQVFDIEGKKFFTFGGGYSIDKPMRIEGRSWWQQEMPTDEELQEGNRNLEKAGYKVDYIITHTLPIKTVATVHRDHGHKEGYLNNYLEYVAENTEYKHWYAGHFHMDRDLHRNISVLWFDMRELDDDDFDYEHFDAEEFFYKIFLNSDNEYEDICDKLNKVLVTEENYISMRKTIIETADIQIDKK